MFNNNSIGLGLELRIKKNKVFLMECLTKDDNDFDYLIYNGHELTDASLNKEIVDFFETNFVKYSFFDGELKTCNKIS